MPRVLLVLALAVPAAADDVATLAKALQTDGAHDAADRLAELGPKAKEAVPHLVAALASEDAELRWRAAWALSRMGREAAPAAPALVLAALREDGYPAAAAYIALKRVGLPGTDAVLASMAQAPEDERAKYLTLLRTVEPKPEAAVPFLIPLLDHPDWGWQACNVLESMGPAADAAVPALIRRLREEPLDTDAQDALVAIGQRSVTPLREWAADASVPVTARGCAIGMLARIPGGGVAAARACILKADDDVWFWAMLHLGEGASGAEDLIPILEQRVTRARDTPSGTAKALMAMGPNGEAALERLLFCGSSSRRADLARELTYLKSDRSVAWLLRLADASQPGKVRRAALESLAESRLEGEAAQRAAKLAQQALGKQPAAACRLAGSLEPTAAADLPDRLRPLLAHRDREVQLCAAAALCRLGRGGEAEVSMITRTAVEARQGRDRGLYREALRCLGQAGAAAAAHRELLVEALSSDDMLVRHVAVEGLICLLPALGDDKWRVIDAVEAVQQYVALYRIDDAVTLVDFLSRDRSAREAAAVLEALGARGWEPLVNALDAPDKTVRVRAARVLIRIDAAKAGERAWTAALASIDATYLIDDLCRDHPQVAIPHLVKALASNDAPARAAAACLLGDLNHREALPAIRDLVAHDPEAVVRLYAIWALDALLPSP